jgi:hypothetical protein
MIKYFTMEMAKEEIVGNTTCPGGGICPYDSAVCCSDNLHCCPSGYSCDLSAGTCDKSSQSIINFFTMELPKKEVGNTTCPGGGICPYDDAVCCSDNLHCCPSGYSCDLSAGTCDKSAKSMMKFFTMEVSKDEIVGNTTCPGGGICPYDDAVCCSDNLHCCPSGYTCDLSAGTCDKSAKSMVNFFTMELPKVEVPTVGNTTCPGGGICPYDNAVCCSDNLHCCPSGYTCDLSAGTCDKSQSSIAFFTMNEDLKLIQ